MLIGTYNFLDVTPQGLDEDEFNLPIAWIRRNDFYI